MLIPQKDRWQEAPDKRLLETIPDNKEHWVYFGILKTTNWKLQVHMKKKPLTKPRMLSSLNSTYDPHGTAAPFMLEGRWLIQRSCHQNLDQEEQIPYSMARQLAAWQHKKLCIIFLMHQSMDMVSVTTSNSLQSSHWKIKNGASEVHLHSLIGTNSSHIINQAFDE